MFSKTATLALAALAFCSTSTAHMIMVQPKPFNAKTINNSPLVGVKPGSATSDFPCKVGKAGPKYDDASVSMNHMKVGDTQKLTFEGSASHGGGTCLLSVSLDQYPDENSVWKIIQTYEGGCPTAADGNDGASNFTFSIPNEIPNGPSTLSWIWYNKIGNREIYMNCAPIWTESSAGTNETYNTLPDAYFINLPPEECSSVETTDLEIPHPGKYMTVLQNTLKAATGPSCQASAAAQTKGVSGGAPSYGGTSSSASAPASSSAQPTSAAGYGGTGSASGSAPAYTSAPSSYFGAPAYSSAASPSTQAPGSSTFPQTTPAAGEGIYGPATTPASAAAPAGTDSTACSQDGFVCRGTKQFGQCASGQLIGGWRDMAVGTECQNNAIVKVKRDDMRHAHVRRHVQNAVLRRAA
ncbi:hypothetical protein AC579_8729 [Pseudocercospora musae]|uniref:Chitin-binding type-4 domain-containing protein n=1 Tax=Pseudocercospora musae TaxID=113226 RepID=A0A139IW87_9PEZI|nr:hypothetical protein AC579_8729 [Pseudocercospora musae]